MNRYTDTVLQNENFSIPHNYENGNLVSLETALTPICSQINTLTQYIKLAKVECHYPCKHGLTHDESAAIYLYTMEWGDNSLYRVLNRALRSERSDEFEKWFLFLKLFNSAINKLPTVKKCVWRGMSGDISKSYKKDQIFTWWNINSCSTSIDVIKNFLSPKSRSFMNFFFYKTFDTSNDRSSKW